MQTLTSVRRRGWSGRIASLPLSFYPHSLVRAKSEVFVLLYVFVLFYLFGQRFLSNPRADSRQSLHAGVAWVGT